MDTIKEFNLGANREVTNMKPVENQSCYEYWLDCTDMYGEYYAMQHFSKKIWKSEFLNDVDALAAYARIELGLSKGDVVTVFMPTTVQSIAAFYAFNKIGVIVNFVHPLLPPESLKEAIEEGHSKCVMILDLLSRKYVDVINESGLPCIVCHSSDYGNVVKATGTKAGEFIMKKKFPEIKNREDYMTAVKRFSKANVKPDCDPDDIAVYLNGGGTTGKSKTIMLTSRAINELACRVSRIDRIHRPGEECEIIVLPLFHCFGLCLATHMAMCNGARLIPLMQYDAKLVSRLMRDNKVIAMVGIPVMFKKLMDDKKFNPKYLKDFRMAFCGGDDAPQTWLDDFNKLLEESGSPAKLRQGYGLTEVGSVCCHCSNWEYKPNSIGKPLLGVEMKIWDDDHNELPVGEIGEMVISGPTIMAGYYHGDKTKLGDGLYTDENGKQWVCSGDLGYVDEDGFFFFSGRKKRIIIISGYNVYPSDIEKKLTEYPFVNEVCLARGYTNGKQLIRMYVSFRQLGDNPPTEAEIEEYKKKMVACVEENFSKFSVPREIRVLRDLPHTPLEKVDFMKLTQNKPEDPEYKEPEKQKASLLPIDL